MTRSCAWVAAALGIISSLTTGCHAFYMVSGRVDSCASRKPIADAQVTLRIYQPKRSGEAQTNADGTFLVAVNWIPDDQPSDFSAKKEGFKDYDVHVTNPKAPQNICLTPVSASPAPERNP